MKICFLKSKKRRSHSKKEELSGFSITSGSFVKDITLYLRVRETGSEVYDTTQPPPPLAAVHGEERETWPREREGGAAKRERERKDAAKREKGERGGAGRERKSTARAFSLRELSAGLRF
ncbi:hypothetical protein F2Q69_00004549 [Brassica cretica]|uniref:Uncharacterized protein n=1 Tax=Brassica cretica TaxID=69181 RepID=A0A8S9P583_BRACR|nr:hypothetical protein F2Q69_00004549 [Brassica cretica]